MGARPSYWRSGRSRDGKNRSGRQVGRVRLGGLLCVLAVAVTWPGPVRAQSDDLAAACSGNPECSLAAATVRLLYPRVGLGLFGGSAVLGSASTVGMRIGSRPRISLSLRGVLVPVELTTLPYRVVLDPPVPPRSTQGDRRVTPGLAGQVAFGILGGWSPEATVGGVGSLDGLLRVSWLGLPADDFEGGAMGVSAALRFGLLRESFTLPGISITGGYGRSTTFTYGDPERPSNGFVRGAVGDWKATAAVSRTVGPVGINAGVSFDRYTGDVEFAYTGAQEQQTAASTTDRWSAYGDVSLTRLVYHFALEGGWQSAPQPGGLPSDVVLDPVGWWLAASFRLSI
jgi:hypothetical protein